MTEIIIKNPEDEAARNQAHLDEYTEYQASRPQLLTPGDYGEFLKGFLGTIGFRGFLEAWWDPDERLYFFPFLDRYWTRAGRVYLEEEDLKNTRLMTFRLKLAECLREAERRDELYKLIDVSRGSDLRNWLVLGR